MVAPNFFIISSASSAPILARNAELSISSGVANRWPVCGSDSASVILLRSSLTGSFKRKRGRFSVSIEDDDAIERLRDVPSPAERSSTRESLGRRYGLKRGGILIAIPHNQSNPPLRSLVLGNYRRRMSRLSLPPGLR